MANKVRCAVYTRKSSEEGLEQEFNSLHAQREACEAFILSQKHEGWKVLAHAYDDGGFSGGSMERPALRHLLVDIRERRIDVVVVYKVDRLTRSLADFAKIVEVLDAHDASFVSVTQQFNTTTSMGRLTLNVLLSFAQFEREVTGERIRDKIAASKKKGMWMGGNVPLGYDVIDRKLVVNKAEAETVRNLFRLYLDLGCVRRVQQEAARLRLTPKRRKREQGRAAGTFGRGQLYHLLANPIYIGKIRHRSESYPGAHEAIVDEPVWDAVQAQLAENRKARRTGVNAREPSLLADLLYDADGNPYTPSHAVKAGKRYRYYVERSLTTNRTTERSPIQRLPAREIETVVLEALSGFLADSDQLMRSTGLEVESVATIDKGFARGRSLAATLSDGSLSGQRDLVAKALRRVVIAKNALELELNVPALRTMLGLETSCREDEVHHLEVPFTLVSRRGALRIVVEASGNAETTSPDPALVKAIVRAYGWWQQLLSGTATGTGDIARAEGIARSYVSRVLRLAFLAPDVTAAILNGHHPPDLTAWRLIDDQTLPRSWRDQRTTLGLGSAER